ncbi:MAG: carboxypeptidase regulatory-like domain-containing protein, partial [Caldilineaceae bacterium]|nr:carboxypeptidase regulatory-like domain-containing protein [Caldilineaceae bacterium]
SFYPGEQKPELSAPGEYVLSSVGGGWTDYTEGSGTSMAAPHVAGLVALLVSADLQDGIRDFDVDELERFMRLTALDLGEPGHDNDYGDGRINAFRAVQWALSAGDLTGTVQDAESGQPVQAQITGSNLREQTRFTTVANAAGFYSTTVPSGTYVLSVTAWGYAGAVFTGQEVVETTLSVADFALEPLPTTRVTGEVLMPTGGVAGATVSVVGADVSTITGVDGSFALELPVGQHELVVRALGHRQLTINVDVAQGQGAAPLTVNLASAPSILLVDADARLGWFYGWPVYNVMAQVLEEQGYSYDLWRIRYPDRTDTFPLVDGRTGYGLPSDATLAQYDVVFWVHSACLSRVTGCIGGLGDDMVARLATYLDNGGRLVLSGQNIASFDDGTDFFDRYVRADLVYDAAATRGDTVLGWGFLQDVELPITNATLYGFRNGVFSLSPDSVAPQREWEYVGPAGETAPNPVASETAVSYPILTYDQGAGAAAQATVSCANASKIVFFALGYENVGPRGEERSPFIGATLQRTLTWLMTPQPASNVVMVPNRLTQTATPGRRISYLLDLYNEGSTDATVQLALENNRWISTLIVDGVALDAGASFTLPPCGHQEVRVQVDVPIGGPVEEADTLRILAQVDSAATATDSTAVTLTTTIQTNWRAEPSMPTARANSVAVAFPDAYHIVTMGGYTAQDSATGATAYPLSSAVEQFNVCTRTWTHWPDLPKPRTGAGAVALNGRIYLVGGTIGSPDLWGYSETATNEVTVYDPAGGTWGSVAPLPQNLTGVAVAAYDGKLYAFGGGRDYYYESNRTWVYDPAVDQWDELAPMPIAGTRYARAAAQNDKIYVVGGYYSSQSTLVYTPATDTWTQATAPEISRSNGALVAAGDGYLYYIGGTVPADGSVERYDIQADTWT